MTRIFHLALLLCLAGCHDAKRDNLFDPELTPPVELAVALDDSAGTVRLTWSAYSGDAPFAAYRVLRRQAENIQLDTLTQITNPTQQSYTDTTLQGNTAYTYRIEVVNTDGFAAPSLEYNTPGFTVRPVELVDVAINAAGGVITLHWNRFRAPGFAAYRIERSSSSEPDFTPIGRIQIAVDTTFTDAALAPDVVYFYRIITEAFGQDWTSNRSSGTQFSLAYDPQISKKPRPTRNHLPGTTRLHRLADMVDRVAADRPGGEDHKPDGSRSGHPHEDHDQDDS